MGARIPKVRIEAHNSKLMREALQALVTYWQWGGYDAMREQLLRDQVYTALELPPRNCDLIDNESEAFDKFVEAVGELAGPESEVAKKVLRVMFANAKVGKEPVEI